MTRTERIQLARRRALGLFGTLRAGEPVDRVPAEVRLVG
jgi:hypothetical protein